MLTLFWTLILLVSVFALLFIGASLWVASFAIAILLLACTALHGVPALLLILYWVLWALPASLNFKPFRLSLSKKLLSLYRKVMPKMSQTEREALNAGSVWWDGELFTGNPDWEKLRAFPKPGLTAEEQSFIDHEVSELCRMIDDWEVTQNTKCLPEAAWQYIRDKGFFGLIIPKEYGGKAFSAQAHSRILLKLFSHSVSAACTVAVPNSLGPAELLLHYGTEDQKNYYLPRLACGEEVPCFALTSPQAGSDATSMPDYGVVCKGQHEGKEVLGMRVNWDKRYITLCPVATVLGLAFKLYDPEHLLGEKENIGITCALIPTSHPGVVHGRRHHPGLAVFQNGPTQGKDVFIPLDWIIGGQTMAGKGWRMLVECLSVGRSISLPTSGVAGCKNSAYIGGAYARTRRQFNLAIGRFEGIEEKLAEIAGLAYQNSAMIEFTLAAVDEGVVPAVPSAILKYHCTENSRIATNHAMDILAGKAVCIGPSNPLALGYGALPIAITVEGANILTRNMIIFGQGSIRCHPFVLKELEAAQMEDDKLALKAFDKAVWGHVGFAVTNIVRSLIHGLTRSHLAKAPKSRAHRYYQYFARFSSIFALLTDSCMGVYGGALKRKERVSARLGDMLSFLYIASAVLKRFHDQNEPEEDWCVVEWCCQSLLFQLQRAACEVLANVPNKPLSKILRFIMMPLGRRFAKPNDRMDHLMAQYLMTPSAGRDRLCEGIYVDEKSSGQQYLFNQAFLAAIEIEPIEKRVRQVQREQGLAGYNFAEVMQTAVEHGIITAAEYETWQAADKLRQAVIKVDSFEKDLRKQ